MWNKIGVNEKGSLTNFPQRCELEDVVFVHCNQVTSGYFNGDINYDYPEDSEFGFYNDDGAFFAADEVSSWCYKADLMQSIEESDSVTPSCTDYIDIPKSINSEEAFIAWMTT